MKKTNILGVMDVIKKRNEAIENKTLLDGLSTAPSNYVVFFLNGSDDIVYIGKKTGTKHDVELYVLERAEKYFAKAYYSELIEYDDLDNALAERILAFEPIFNKSIPRNNRFISINQVKEKYRISKREFSQMAKRHGSYTFGSMIYILKSVFDDEIGKSQPYHKNMPKDGATIVLIDKMDVDYMVKRSSYWDGYLDDRIQSIEENSMEDGSSVTTITTTLSSPDKVYERLQRIKERIWRVSNIIDHERFEITKDGIRKTLSMDGFSEEWVKAPSWDTIEEITSKYEEFVRCS